MSAPWDGNVGRYRRVGLIVPSSNVTIETEVPALLGAHPRAAGERCTFHSSRAVLHRVDADSLAKMLDDATRCASELADARVEIVAYACLIAVMAQGSGAHVREERRLADVLAGAGCPVPVTSSAGALVRRLQDLGLSRVALVAPYLRPLTQVVVSYLEAFGIEVVDACSLEVADNVAVGRLDPIALAGRVRALDLSRAQGVIASACVQMPSLPVLETIQQQLGLPVLSAATATTHEILDHLGWEPVIEGAGAALSPEARSPGWSGDHRYRCPGTPGPRRERDDRGPSQTPTSRHEPATGDLRATDSALGQTWGRAPNKQRTGGSQR